MGSNLHVLLHAAFCILPVEPLAGEVQGADCLLGCDTAVAAWFSGGLGLANVTRRGLCKPPLTTLACFKRANMACSSNGTARKRLRSHAELVLSTFAGSALSAAAASSSSFALPSPSPSLSSSVAAAAAAAAALASSAAASDSAVSAARYASRCTSNPHRWTTSQFRRLAGTVIVTQSSA